MEQNPYEPRYFILKGHEAVPAEMMEWARWFGTAEWHVAKDDVGPLYVSTVFLGLDHNFSSDGPPLIFETIIFGPPEDSDFLGKLCEFCPDLEIFRYATWDEAEQGHKVACNIARQYLAEAGALLAPSVDVKQEKEC